MRGKILAAAAVLVTGAVVAAGFAVSAEADDNARSVAGTWTVTVDPDGPPPPFQSTIAFMNGGSLVEATSKVPSSAGVGTWSHGSNGQFSMTFVKYRFDGTGAFIGTTVVEETGVVDAGGDAYNGHATTRILNASGGVVTTFTSATHMERMG
jgi:hypothetical protein